MRDLEETYLISNGEFIREQDAIRPLLEEMTERGGFASSTSPIGSPRGIMTYKMCNDSFENLRLLL